MNNTILDLWNGNIASCEYCGANDTEANHLIGLIERNRENLSRELSDAQKETFQKYIDCTDGYLLRMLELAFSDGFTLGSKLMIEILT